MSITTWFLEMTSPEQLRPARRVEGFEVRRLPRPEPALSRRMYDAVGEPWQWTDRLGWGVARWGVHLGRPEVETWVGRLDGEEVGYAELVRTGADRVWLHTCSLDSPAALPAYERRGFRRYDERAGR